MAETEYAEARKIAQKIILAQVTPTGPGCANLSISGLEGAITEALSTLLAREERLSQLVTDHEEVAQDKRRLARELDVALNGEKNAARQASLCDLIPDAERLKAENARLREALKLAEQALAKHTSAASAGNGPSQKAYDALLAVRAALDGEPS